MKRAEDLNPRLSSVSQLPEEISVNHDHAANVLRMHPAASIDYVTRDATLSSFVRFPCALEDDVLVYLHVDQGKWITAPPDGRYEYATDHAGLSPEQIAQCEAEEERLSEEAR